MPLVKPCMTADDYWSLPEGEHAELVDGELWALAAPSRLHQGISMQLGGLLSSYIAQHGGSCKVYAAPLSIICDKKKLSRKGCDGAPDLVVEIVSPSSRGMDYGTKQNLYREAGVREYWIVDPSMHRTMVTRFYEDPAPSIHPFNETISVGIFPNLSICLEDVMKNA